MCLIFSDSFPLVLNSFRTAQKKAAAAVESAPEDTASEAEEPAKTSDIEMPDVEDVSDEEKANHKKKEKIPPKKKGKKKGKGGVMIPDEWPWEDAKTIFEKPDVLPADQIEVQIFLLSSMSTDLVL